MEYGQFVRVSVMADTAARVRRQLVDHVILGMNVTKATVILFLQEMEIPYVVDVTVMGTLFVSVAKRRVQSLADAGIASSLGQDIKEIRNLQLMLGA